MANTKSKKKSFTLTIGDSKIKVQIDESNPGLGRSLRLLADDIDGRLSKPKLRDAALNRIGYESEHIKACSAEDLISELSKIGGIYPLDGSRGIQITDYQCADYVVKITEDKPKASKSSPKKNSKSKK